MTYRLSIQPPAKRDVDHIYDWLRQYSPDGADRWFAAFEKASRGVLRHPEGYGLALEDELVEDTLRQFLFKTRRGRTYRGVFVVVVDDEVGILRVRGPGQAPLEADEME